jgi:hypothetical protein
MKVGGVLPSSTIMVYPVDGEVIAGEENNHHYRSVDGNTRCVVLQEMYVPFSVILKNILLFPKW